MATLNRRIDELKKKLRAMSWAEFDQAEYKLRDTALLDGGGGILELNAIFMSPKSREPVSRTGRSEPSDKLEYRVETALADLLKRTLFDPDLGPYGLLKVEKCMPPSADEEDYVLTVRPPARIKLEDGLAYELGRTRSGGGQQGLKIFFHPEFVRTSADGTTQVQFSRFSQNGKANPTDICRSIASRDSPILLLVRYSIPRTAEGESYGNLRRP